jgi:hypothetical protein
MIHRTEGGCDLPSPLHLDGMALSIAHRQKEELAALLLSNGRRDGGIQPAARQDDCSITRWLHRTHSSM